MGPRRPVSTSWAPLLADLSSPEFSILLSRGELTSLSWQKFAAEPLETQLRICIQSMRTLDCEINQRAMVFFNTLSYIKVTELWRNTTGDVISSPRWVKESKLLYDIRAICKCLYPSKNQFDKQMETIRTTWPDAAPDRLIQMIPETIRPNEFTASHAYAFAKVARCDEFDSLKDLEMSLVKYIGERAAKMTNKACSARDVHAFEKWLRQTRQDRARATSPASSTKRRRGRSWRDTDGVRVEKQASSADPEKRPGYENMHIDEVVKLEVKTTLESMLNQRQLQHVEELKCQMSMESSAADVILCTLTSHRPDPSMWDEVGRLLLKRWNKLWTDMEAWMKKPIDVSKPALATRSVGVPRGHASTAKTAITPIVETKKPVDTSATPPPRVLRNKRPIDTEVGDSLQTTKRRRISTRACNHIGANHQIKEGNKPETPSKLTRRPNDLYSSPHNTSLALPVPKTLSAQSDALISSVSRADTWHFRGLSCATKQNSRELKIHNCVEIISLLSSNKRKSNKLAFGNIARVLVLTSPHSILAGSATLEQAKQIYKRETKIYMLFTRQQDSHIFIDWSNNNNKRLITRFQEVGLHVDQLLEPSLVSAKHNAQAGVLFICSDTLIWGLRKPLYFEHSRITEWAMSPTRSNEKPPTSYSLIFEYIAPGASDKYPTAFAFDDIPSEGLAVLIEYWGQKLDSSSRSSIGEVHKAMGISKAGREAQDLCTKPNSKVTSTRGPAAKTTDLFAGFDDEEDEEDDDDYSDGEAESGEDENMSDTSSEEESGEEEN